jgi:hypothetical protein
MKAHCARCRTPREIHYPTSKIDHLDIEAAVRFAEYVITHAARLWQKFTVDQKQRLQRVLFPEGLRFGNGEFETAATNTIFTQLRVAGSEKSQLASPTGFEP